MSRCVIAISGGIGSGKSVVSKVVRLLGYSVYDCDSQAKKLMDSSAEIKKQISDLIGHQVIENGLINRKLLSEIVFSDSNALITLNSIVHGAVKTDIEEWLGKQEKTVVFIETAILHQSGLDKMVDRIWEITAPESLRIRRVMKRNGFTKDQVQARIDSQKDEQTREFKKYTRIINDGMTPLLPQIENLLSTTRY